MLNNNDSESTNPLERKDVLDHGFVELLDVLGSDNSIVDAARTSYDKGTKKMSNTQGLIRYLMRHKHMGPFEFGEFVFRIRCPIFVARQWFRHRTASYNEVSLRYSEARDDFYIPSTNLITTQDRKNRQARTNMEVTESENIKNQMTVDVNYLMNHYQMYLEKDVAREIARINLPLSLYTTFLFKINLRNLLNFLVLRFDSHAQFEIRQYAEIILNIVEKYFPLSLKAWKDYDKDAINFSATELQIIQKIFQKQPDLLEYTKKEMEDPTFSSISQGEKDEFIEKIQRILN